MNLVTAILLPDGRLDVFPQDLTVARGSVVTWQFSCPDYPDHPGQIHWHLDFAAPRAIGGNNGRLASDNGSLAFTATDPGDWKYAVQAYLNGIMVGEDDPYLHIR